MKAKLVIIGLMISCLLAVSVSAQKLTNLRVILQDDKSGDHLTFDIPTGEYKVENCKRQISAGGIGKVKLTGCQVTLQDVSDTRRVMAELDLCAGVGKADITLLLPSPSNLDPPPTLEFGISDSNFRDSIFDCDFKVVDVK